MSSMSRPATTSDAKVVDLEKGLMAAATEEEAELAVVNPRLATCIRATMDVIVVAYTLINIGVMVWAVKASNNWDPWPRVVFYAICLLCTLSMAPMVKDILVKRCATKHTLASNSDVTAKLLASKK